MYLIKHVTLLSVGLTFVANSLYAANPWIIYDGNNGPGNGKHVVLVSGDEEYRSEEALPQLGKMLAKHHGFKCTVLFAIDPETGEISPNHVANIPGMEALKTADLMIIATRFRNLKDEQMQFIDDYLKSGRPVIGMRTATHAFKINDKSRKYAHYSNSYTGDKKAWTGGFGRLVLGEKWINHHGHHKFESTRGLIAQGAQDHPIVRGIKDGDIYGPTDVYGLHLPLPGDSQYLVMGQVLKGMDRNDPPAPPSRNHKTGKMIDKNNPMMPIAWIKSYQLPSGKKGHVFTTTMGAASDMASEGVRRLLINAVYWCVGLADRIPDCGTNANVIGEFTPSPYGFNGYIKGVKPADLLMK
ncbi:ThuA domain-containing protein [Planctomycetota bacterium]